MTNCNQRQQVETLRWQDGRLEMIDQRVLPAKFEYLRYQSAGETAEGIRSMVVRGAPAIGCAAAYGVALEALRQRLASPDEFTIAMNQAFEVLAASRPTAVNLFWALKRMRAKWESLGGRAVGEIADALLAEAHEVLAEDIRINRAMGAFGADLLPDGARVLTHCNAGALATAGHGTALGVIRSAVAAGKKLHVFADETRPFLQGARLTAWELAKDHIPVPLITDNMAGHFMKSGEIKAVIVGADRIASNGDVANKIGTYSVAVLAPENKIPFYVAAGLATVDMSLASGDQIPIEERAPSEVTHWAGVATAPESVAARHPAFDVTPNRYVTAIITERGIARAPYTESLKAWFS